MLRRIRTALAQVFDVAIPGSPTANSPNDLLKNIPTAVETGIKALCLTVSGTLSYLDAGGEQTAVEFQPAARVIVHNIWLDLVNMTQNGTVKVYFKVDGTTYRLFKSVDFTVATDPDGMLLDVNAAIDDDLKVTYTEGADEGADRDLPYKLIYEERE